MNDKFLLSILAVLFIVSALALSFIERRQADPDYQKNWWALYFVDPHSDSLNFTIENHSDATHFNYTITQDKEVIVESATDIPQGQSQTVTVEKKPTVTGRSTVTVWTDDRDKRDIYR